MLLEICCYSPAAAILAAKCGANRIELCDNPGDGGTTPPFGVLKWAKENISIPVFPIIRPRGGHFVYTGAEINMIAEDIKICKQIGYEGVVIGCLNEQGNIAYSDTARLVELAWPMEVTFHRAFDRVRDPFEALEQIAQAGCHRILTSGQCPTAPAGSTLIGKLVKEAPENLIIMPGSGVRAANIAQLYADTGAVEFHSSASVLVAEDFFIPESMKETLSQTMPDENEIRGLVAELGKLKGKGL